MVNWLSGSPNQDWICIGACDDLPLYINRESSVVYLGSDYGEDVPVRELAENVIEFVNEYLLGDKYEEFSIADDDPWLDKLAELRR